MNLSLSLPSVLICLLLPATLRAGTAIRYTTFQLTGNFYAEGAAYADVNKDGNTDIIYGPFWYAGPDWKSAHEIYEPVSFKPDNEYSKNFVSYAADLNSDGWPDYLVLGFPGDLAYWFENPKGKEARWVRHDIFKILDNESPAFADISGDGKPEIICSSGGYFGFGAPNWSDPAALWEFHQISPKQVAGGKFTHGLGIGDVNGDGRTDLLEKNGWWEQPADSRQEWPQHAFNFSAQGGSQMFAYDFDGDGDNDVLTSEFAHGYGLTWFENTGGGTNFTPHKIMGAKPEENSQGVFFSQLHAVDLADMNGDGIKDIVTGKRYFAHGSKGDADPLAPPVVYWFEVIPGKKSGAVKFVAHFIDDDSGVGTQVAAADVTGDGLPDIVVGNKKGCHVSVARKVEVDAEGFETIFDGKSLDGWEGDLKFWRVENGCIVGESTDANPLTRNTFLTYRRGKVADFDLRLKFRLTGTESANSGIQFRGQDKGDFKIVGYQADMDRTGKYLGCLWDEDGRGMLAGRGAATAWAADGTKTERPSTPEVETAASVKLDEWNEYAITARSHKMQLRINGKVTAECTDEQKDASELYGWLALQLHSGPPTKIEWKEVRMKRDLE